MEPIKPIPISAAQAIAEDYGYDQVIIYARRVGSDPEPHGEHLTTYGRNKKHCAVAARIADYLINNVLCWNSEPKHATTNYAQSEALSEALSETEVGNSENVIDTSPSPVP